MFYEMCFHFATSMERIFVLQNLRLKEVVMPESVAQDELKKKQVTLIKQMLCHDPSELFLLLFLL